MYSPPALILILNVFQLNASNKMHVLSVTMSLLLLTLGVTMSQIPFRNITFHASPRSMGKSMDFSMLLGEAWNVIPSKCHLPLNGYSLAHGRTYHGMDIHMLGDYLEYKFHIYYFCYYYYYYYRVENSG